LAKPEALPTFSKGGIVYVDDGLSDLTPVGILISSGTLIGGALTFDSLVGNLATASGVFSKSLTVSGIPVDISAGGGPGAGVSSLNGQQGSIILQGQGGTTVTTVGTTITISGEIGSGVVSDHSALSNLDFENSGHTGFASYAELTTTSGHLQTQIDSQSAAGVLSVNGETGILTVTGTAGVVTETSGGLLTLSSDESQIDHDQLLNFEELEHFTEASIDHTNIQNVGNNTHLQIDMHLSELATSGTNVVNSLTSHTDDSSLHFTVENIDHGTVSGLGDDDHIQYALVDGSRGFTGAVQGIDPTLDADLATKRYVDQEVSNVAGGPGVVLGTDGNTVISGTNQVTIQGFRTEFVTASGSLQSQIFSNDSDISINAVGISNNTISIVTTSGHLQSQIDGIDNHPRYTDAEAVSATEALRVTLSGHLQSEIDSNTVSLLQLDGEVTTLDSQLVTASGHLQNQIDSFPITSGTVSSPNALQGVDGITIISGSNVDTVQGFRNEFVAASGSLQSQIASIDTGSPMAGKALVGSDGITIVSGTSDIEVQGFRSEFVNVSGSLQSQIDSNAAAITDSNFLIVTSSGHLQQQINDIEVDELEPAIVGLDGITVVSGANTVNVSGFRSEVLSISGSLQSDIIDSNALVLTTSGHLQQQIDNLDETFATDAQLITVSGHLQSQIDSIDVNEPEIAIVGSDGIVVVSGSDSVDIQGFRSEFIAASGSLQNDILNNTALLTTTSGHLQGQIDSNFTGIDNNASNIAAVTLSGSTHSGDSSIHFMESSIDHVNIQNIGNNTHAEIDTHLENLAVSGTSTNAELITVSGHLQTQIDSNSDAATQNTDLITTTSGSLQNSLNSHVADTSIHFTESSIVHGNLQGLANDDHPQYALVDGSRTFSDGIRVADNTTPSRFLGEVFINNLVVTGTQTILNTVTDIMENLSVSGSATIGDPDTPFEDQLWLRGQMVAELDASRSSNPVIVITHSGNPGSLDIQGTDGSWDVSNQGNFTAASGTFSNGLTIGSSTVRLFPENIEAPNALIDRITSVSGTFSGPISSLSTTSFNLRSLGNIIADGNLGVGTTTPNAKLQVIGNVSINPPGNGGVTLQRDFIGTQNINFQDFDGNTRWSLIHGTSNLFSIRSGAGADVIRLSENAPLSLSVASNGFVGVSKITPTVPLDVSGAGLFSGTLGVTGAGTFNSTVQIDGNVGIGAAPLPDPAVKLLASRSDGAAAIRIDATGTGQSAIMQIQSLDANSLLEFRRDSAARWSFRNDGADTFSLRDTALNNVLSVPQSGDVSLTRPLQVEDYVSIKQGGVERWRIAENSGFLFFGSDNTSFQPQVVIEDTAPVNTLRVAANGRVGINQPNPAVELHLVGSAAITGQLNMLGTEPILIPRLNSAQRDAIASPVVSSIIFNLDTLSFQLFNGFSWISLTANVDLSGHIPDPELNQQINIVTRSTETLAIAEMFSFTGSGSATYTLSVDGTPVTGISNVTTDTTTRTNGRAATGANIISAGSLLSLTINSISSAVDLSFTVRTFKL